MSIEHSKYLSQKFDIKVPLDGFDDKAKWTLEKYGCWLAALGGGAIGTFTDAQAQFVKVHQGKQAPKTRFEIIWMKYKLEEKFVLALDAAQRLPRGDRVMKTNVKARFEALAKLGHKGASDWLEKAKLNLSENGEGIEGHEEVENQQARWADSSETGYAPGPSSIQPDWSVAFDDMGAEEWEDHLGGPDE